MRTPSWLIGRFSATCSARWQLAFGTKDLRVSGRFGFLEFARDSTPPTMMNNELTIDKVNRLLLSMTKSTFWATYIVKHVLHLQFPALRSKHVYIRDKVAVLKTINAIRQGGVNNLQVRILISI